jgi:hypothetical protein
MSKAKNHSSISHLVKHALKFTSYTGSKETEPRMAEPLKIKEPLKESVAEKVEKAPQSESETQTNIQVDPEVPEVSEELKEAGVETVKSSSVFVNNKKIELPISPDDLNEASHKPITSGARWLAEITMYILNKSHLVLRRVGKGFEVVQK